MRKTALAVAVCLVPVAVATGAGTSSSAQGAPAASVSVSCPADPAQGGVTVTVTPWIYEVNQGQDAQWDLTTNGDPQARISVAQKRPGAANWPYAAGGQPGQGRYRASQMRPSQQGRQFGYNITVFCGNEEIVIDPKMKVRG